jgi:branched-chain amino acid transport system permease protein
MNTAALSLRNFYVFLALLAAIVILHLPITQNLPPFPLIMLLLCGINIILGSSLNLVNGWMGQFSLGTAGFMAVGAYVSAYITATTGAFGMMAQFVFLFATVAGGLVAALLGYLVGLPSLRLKGDYLAVVTLGFSEIIRVVILNMDVVGGARGFVGIPNLSNFAWVYGWVIVTLYVLYRLYESQQGRQWVAVREDEVATEAVGVSTTKTKVNAFVLSSFFAGIAGSLFAHLQSYLNPASFTMAKTTECLIMVVLGGMGSLTGSVIAAVFVTLLPEGLRGLQDYTGVDLRMVIYSALLIVIMLVRPKGLLGRHEIWKWIHKS